MDYAACVIHLGLVRGAVRLGATCVAVVAGLCGGDAGVRVRAVLGSGPAGVWSRSERAARRTCPGALAALQRARRGWLVAEHRQAGVLASDTCYG